MVHDLIMPKMGESITEATILRWFFNEGDTVKQDDPILEIATDKVDSEIPAPMDGRLVQIFFKVNDVVPVGALIAKISDGVYDENVENSAVLLDFTEVEPTLPTIDPGITVPFQPYIKDPQVQADQSDTSSKQIFYSPLVRTIAQQEKIELHELDALMGTGADGRVTKQDVLNYVDSKKLKNKDKSADRNEASSLATSDGTDEIIEMDRMRRLISDHMIQSKNTSAHVTSFIEVDVTEIVLWRNKHKAIFQKKYNQNITFTPIFIQSVIKAIKEYPLINASLHGYQIIKKKDIHIGMATALPSGNLIVPVIKYADRMNLQGLVHTVNDLATRARDHQLKPDEISGGTFTITNIGSFGSLMGTPIINQPQLAILAVGVIKKKPVVLETPQGDVIAIRHCMYMSLSYDHRVIDGFLGGSFLKKIADLLESFDPNTTI